MCDETGKPPRILANALPWSNDSQNVTWHGGIRLSSLGLHSSFLIRPSAAAATSFTFRKSVFPVPSTGNASTFTN